jgi:hypothetical protein
MRVFIRIAIFFYVMIISVVGSSALFLLAKWTTFKDYERFFLYVYHDPKAGTIGAFVVAATMILSFVFARVIYGRQERERIITFDNPLGQVTISVSALEDLVSRLAVLSPQIKEIRPDIIAGKRGIKVNVRLILRSDVNISELTAEFQEVIKRKIQDVIGREERILVRIHVIKITTDNVTPTKASAEIEPPLHFHGYRA